MLHSFCFFLKKKMSQHGSLFYFFFKWGEDFSQQDNLAMQQILLRLFLQLLWRKRCRVWGSYCTCLFVEIVLACQLEVGHNGWSRRVDGRGRVARRGGRRGECVCLQVSICKRRSDEPSKKEGEDGMRCISLNTKFGNKSFVFKSGLGSCKQVNQGHQQGD